MQSFWRGRVAVVFRSFGRFLSVLYWQPPHFCDGRRELNWLLNQAFWHTGGCQVQYPNAGPVYTDKKPVLYVYFPGADDPNTTQCWWRYTNDHRNTNDHNATNCNIVLVTNNTPPTSSYLPPSVCCTFITPILLKAFPTVSLCLLSHPCYHPLNPLTVPPTNTTSSLSTTLSLTQVLASCQLSLLSHLPHHTTPSSVPSFPPLSFPFLFPPLFRLIG